jgi:hypothetical protein
MTLWEVIRLIRHAPKHMKEMAKDLSHLSASLHNLRRIARAHEDLCSDKLRSDIKSALRHVHRVHRDVKGLVNSNYSGIRRVHAAWKARKAKEMLARVGALTGTINVMVASVQVAATHRNSIT